ncbi:hypothetical protein AsFPU3_2948 [Aphanothece sacrum FPU3]|nr:hypothetical protein AsFPU3_2948 [Aphanothece sacrum FPU3]
MSVIPDARQSQKGAESCYAKTDYGHVAQWIEHQVPVLRVGGSNPSVFVLIVVAQSSLVNTMIGTTF